MHKKFQKRFSQLQDLLNEYENEIKNISHAQANQLPPSGGWTIAEVLYHISLVEKGIIQYIKNKLATPAENKNSGLKSFYRAALLRYALRSKRKFKAPKVLDKPQGPYDTTQLMAEWRSTRLVLENLINTVGQKDVNRQLFKHPIVGKINLKQTLGFMADHKQRHLDQIRQIKTSLQ